MWNCHFFSSIRCVDDCVDVPMCWYVDVLMALMYGGDDGCVEVVDVDALC
jgi:hypothetical protein